MTRIPFQKMHGAGNDFVVIFKEALPPQLSLSRLATAVCDRQLGIGADQLLLLSQENGGDKLYRMDIYNADGSTAQMCGNGLRCVASYLRDEKLIQGEKGSTPKINTPAGIRQVRWLDDGGIAINMSKPIFEFAKIPAKFLTASEIAEGGLVPIQVGGEFFSAVLVSMGNPHCVIFTSASIQKRVAELGPKIEHHPYFPERANVMFARMIDGNVIDVAHWERGSGMTLACGSGACATAAAAIKRGMLGDEVVVRMRGGDLKIIWGGKKDDDIWMSGPVATVFRGEYFVTSKES